MTMLRYRTHLALVLVLSVLLTGCWNRRELNDMAFMIGYGIDRTEEGFEVSAQVVDPSQLAKNKIGERSPTFVHYERAPTLFEAQRAITTKSSRRMYASHVRLVVLDEAIARAGIREPLDFLFRDHEFRPDFFIVVARGVKAKDVLGFVTPTEVLPAMELHKSLTLSEEVWAPTTAVRTKELMQWLLDDTRHPVLTGIRLTGDVEAGQKLDNAKQPFSLADYKLSGIGVFKGDRLVGWLNESESKAYSYIVNRVDNTVGYAKCPGEEGLFTVEVTEAKTKIVPLVVRGKPRIRLETRIDGNVGEMQCRKVLKEASTFEELERAGREQVLAILRDGIHKVQKTYGSDIFGFGEAFHRHHPKQWHAWKKEWDDIFRDQLEVDIALDYRLSRTGKMTNPLQTE